MIQYLILSHHKEQELQAEVTKKLSEGWELKSFAVVGSASQGYLYFQTMVKHNENNN